MKKISVVTVTYNCVNTVKETLESVIQQDYSNFEYIVVDGFSNDGTVDIINKYKESLKTFISEPDKGIFDAMNKSLDYVTGDYVIFMNSGDKFVSKSILSDVFNNYDGNDDLIYGDCYVHNKLGFLFVKGHAIYSNTYKKRDLVFKGQGFSHQSLFTKVSKLKDFKFDLHYPLGADFHTTWSIYEKGNKSIKYLGRPVSVFDDTVPGTSHTGKFIPNIISERVNMFCYKLTLFDKIDIFFKKMKVNFKYSLKQHFPYLINFFRYKKRNYINKIR